MAQLALTAPLPVPSLACLICPCAVSTTAVAFGLYAPLSGLPVLSTGNVSVRCTATATATASVMVNYTIDLGTGSNSSSFSPRLMASGSKRLNYDLFVDSARLSVCLGKRHWRHPAGSGHRVHRELPGLWPHSRKPEDSAARQLQRCCPSNRHLLTNACRHCVHWAAQLVRATALDQSLPNRADTPHQRP